MKTYQSVKDGTFPGFPLLFCPCQITWCCPCVVVAIALGFVLVKILILVPVEEQLENVNDSECAWNHMKNYGGVNLWIITLHTDVM